MTRGDGFGGQEDDGSSSVFPAVPFEAVDRRWVTLGMHGWKGSGTLPVFEARSSSYAAKHSLRQPVILA